MPDQLNAWQLILNGDPTLLAIVRLSLAVSLSAVALAALAGMPLGALLALTRFPGRSALVVLLNALMGLPPVVVGLAVYLLLSRSGPLGAMGILFTPSAMVIAQRCVPTRRIATLIRSPGCTRQSTSRPRQRVKVVSLSGTWMQRVAQVSVLSANDRCACRELRVNETAEQRHNSAGNPRAENQRNGVNSLGDQIWINENAGADDATDYRHRRAEQPELTRQTSAAHRTLARAATGSD